MITGKFRCLSFMFVLILCSFVLCGCFDDHSSDDAFDLLSSMKGDGYKNEDNSTKDTFIPKYYRVVIPSDCSPEVASLGRTASDRIEEITGIESGLVYDGEAYAYREDAFEVLIGKTERNSTLAAFDELKRDDYVCRYSEGALVIGGISDAATLTALERFVNEILPSASAQSLMPSAETPESSIPSARMDRWTASSSPIRLSPSRWRREPMR